MENQIQRKDDLSVNIGIEENQRDSVAQKLSKFLASTYSLYLKTLYYHWNVTGNQFSSLHALFEDQYQDLHTAGDEIAERIRAIGHFVPGTMKQFLELSSVVEDTNLPESSRTMVQNLLKDNEEISKEARTVLQVAEQAGDEVSTDMMVARMTYHDKTAWMLRATLDS